MWHYAASGPVEHLAWGFGDSSREDLASHLRICMSSHIQRMLEYVSSILSNDNDTFFLWENIFVWASKHRRHSNTSRVFRSVCSLLRLQSIEDHPIARSRIPDIHAWNQHLSYADKFSLDHIPFTKVVPIV